MNKPIPTLPTPQPETNQVGHSEHHKGHNFIKTSPHSQLHQLPPPTPASQRNSLPGDYGWVAGPKVQPPNTVKIRRARLSHPNIGKVFWKSTWDQEQHIDADYIAILGKTGRQPFGGESDPAQAIFIERPGRSFLAAALFDFDKGESSAASCDQVDLTARNARTPCQNAPALQPEPPGRERLRSPPPCFRQLPVQLLPASSSARA